MSRLGALRMLDRDKWVRTVKRAMKAHGGKIPEAAAELEVSMRTLFRWLDEKDFADVARAPVGPRK